MRSVSAEQAPGTSEGSISEHSHWPTMGNDSSRYPRSTDFNKKQPLPPGSATEAIPLQDQTAASITAELVKWFTVFGRPNILHSDKGRNFESTLLAETLKAFGVKKTHTTAYHLQGDGMFELLNSLLQLLHTYVDKQEDWKKYLHLVLFAYCSAPHSSTGCSPFFLMFGRQPSTSTFSSQFFRCNLLSLPSSC